MNWSDLNWEKSYSPIRAYAQSKLANILFTKELANRLKGYKNNIFIRKKIPPKHNYNYQFFSKPKLPLLASLEIFFTEALFLLHCV